VIPADLARAVTSLLARPRVLVALDFDGVLAPLVSRPADARPLRGTMTAVRRLARFEGVEVALVSGRHLASLRAASGVSDEDALSLVGSHGAEAALQPALGATVLAEPMTPATSRLLERVVTELESIAATDPDGRLFVEVKPTGAALHTRRAPEQVAQRAAEQAVAGPASWAGVHVTLGKSVVELAVIESSKGIALQHIRAASPIDGVLYVGDDVTDESAFAVLGPDDVTVKVGPGETHAAYRLEGPEDARELLQLLVAVAERSQR
jgi:trehalose 6-phosphate phosphatase